MLCYTPPKSRRMQCVCTMSSFWLLRKHKETGAQQRKD